MMANKSPVSLMQHLGGVGAILKGRGVNKLQTPTSRRTFYEYRAIQLPVNLVSRQAGFLSSPEWIDPPWKYEEPQSVTCLQTVIDIAYSIPVLMQKSDSLQRLAQTSRDTSPFESLYRLMVEALGVQRAFDDWKLRFQGSDETYQLYIPRLTTRPEKTNINNVESTYPISFAFTTWDAAAASVYYAMSRIYLNGLMEAIQTDIHNFNTSSNMVDTEHLKRNSIACADRVCQSIEWFFEDHKKMIGRMVVLAPFEAARGLFVRLCEVGTSDQELDASLKQKVRFCETVTQRIKDGGLPIWEE